MLVSCFSRGARYLHPHTPSVTACFRIRPRSMTDDITFKMNINPDRFNLFQIGAKVNITHNVKMFRISLPNPESIVEFKSIPSYIIFKTDDKSNNKNGTQYIPISYSDQKGYLDVLIKNNPEDAVAGQLHTMPEGGFVSIKGPFAYDCFQYRANMRETIHMIAGGSGIAVMLQVIREIFRQEQNEDKTKVRLLYANRSEADTALRVAFDDLHYNLPDRFEVTYLFENKIENSDSVLSSEYLPRLSGEEQQHLVLEEEEDGDEYDYVMMPQMVHSNITSEVVEAFLQDEFLSPSESAGSTDVGADANDHAEEEEEKKYRKPLVLVCGPPRMVELLAGRGGARAEANRLRKTKRQASGPETSNTDASTTAPSAGSLLGGILGDLHYTDDMVVTF